MSHDTSAHSHDHSVSYGKYTVIWLTLIALTVVTVAVAAIDLGSYTLFVALLIAAIKAMIVINVFMHIKYDDILIKFLLGACGFIIIVIFIFLGIDLLQWTR